MEYPFSYPGGVSADGNAFVGEGCTDGFATCHAFLWTQAGGMTDLGALPGYTISWASNVSADGNVATGSVCTDGYATCDPILWTPASGSRS